MKKIYTLLFALMMTGLGFGQVFITELADPNNSAGSRYVELYNAGATSVDLSTWALRRWTNANAGPQADVSLSGTIPANGFIVFAANSATFSATFTSFTGTVIQLGGGGPVDSNGDDNIALVDNTNTIVDIFGVPGEDGSLTCHEFEDGRAERAASITSGNPIWDESEWNVWADSPVTGCTNHTNSAQDAPGDFDPGDWIGAAPPSMDTEVSFIGTSVSVSEGIGTFELEFTIINEDAAATSFDVVLTVGDNTDIDSYVTETVTFPGGSAADQVVELTITDDALFETDETLTFEIQNVLGGSSAVAGANNSFDLTITNNDAPPTIALPYTEDFSDCGAAQWVDYDENASSSWTCASGAYTMNGFPNSDDIDWLISNFSIDFDLTSNETIAVTTSEQFGDDINDFGEFELRYSTDYLGYGDPTGATWTALAFDPNNTSTGFGASADSVTSVDASGITGTAYLAFFYDAAAGSGPEEWNITEILIQEGALPTSVEFVGTSASVAEDSGTYDLIVAITNEDATNDTTFDVVLTSGDNADVNGYISVPVTFLSTIGGTETVTVTITDDILEELDETFTFEIQNVAGGNSAAVGTNNSFDLTILANDEPVLPGTLYDADFSNDGDGFPAHTTASPPATGPASVGPFGTAPNAWSLSYDTTPGTDGSDNIFEVIGGELVSDDWGGQGIFTSQVIDVTGISVVDITATGINIGANDNDFTYFYILDGGSRVETVIGATINGDPVNFSELGLNVSAATTLQVGFEFSENGGGDGYGISEFLVIEGATTTSVQFATTSDSVFEDAGTYDLTFEILFEDATNATTFDVVLTSGDAADVNSYSTQTVTFPAGSSANQTVTVTITDDLIDESNEVFTFEIQNVAGGSSASVGTNNTFDLTIQDNDGFTPLPGDIVISEIMYNSSGGDDEWIEIFNASGADITLDSDWRLNYGSNTFDFGGSVIASNSYLTIALGSNGDGSFNNDNPFTPDVSTIGTPVATTNNSNNLVNSTATIELIFEPSGANTTIDTVTYDDGSPWPTNPDGNGPSLELIDVAFDNSLAASWVASGDYNGGTPGAEYVAPIIYTFNGTWSPSDPNGVATTSDDIVIASGDATFNTNTTCNRIDVLPGASITVTAGVTLTPTDILQLQSSSTSYSSLILDGTVAGSILYDRHVNINGSGSTGSNDLISAPLTGQSFSVVADGNPNILNNGTLYLFGPFEKTTGSFVTWAGTETATLDPGVGYRAATSDNTVVTFGGTAENGNVTYDLVNGGTNNEEWNLVGNPYPSYLNVQDFLLETGSGLQNIQLFDPPTAAIYGYDGSALNGWTVYNLATTTASTVMAPGQGFFVSANAANTAGFDLLFTPDMRRTGSGDDFIVGRNAELVYVKLKASTANDTFGTDIYFNNNASQGFDFGYDASLWGDTTPDFALYSHLIQDNTGVSMALQALNASNLADVTIPLGVNANQGEQLTFSIADSTLPESVSVYLDDVVANTSTLLNNSDYIITPATSLSGTGRFFLRTSEDALSTIENSLDTLNIFALNSSKELVVNGQLQDNTVLNLFDIQGRKVLSTQLDNASLENRIDTSNLSGGVYVVTVQNNGQQKTQKVIIK